MEEIIKKGEYCRTSKGIIFQAEKTFLYDEEYKAVFECEICEHNKRLAVIIHPKDKVNGKVLVKKEYNNNDTYIFYLHGGYIVGENEVETVMAREYLDNGIFRV